MDPIVRTTGFVDWNLGRLRVCDCHPMIAKACCCAALACGQRSCVVHHVHSLFAERDGNAFAPHRCRRSVAERLMRAPAIVENNPGGDAGLDLAAIGVALEVDVLELERAPQPLY
jgi:hypothetical protein